MKSPRLLVLCWPLLLIASACAEAPATFTRTEDVIYGRKFGTALTLDVIQPAGTKNGYGIIFMVSGGWFSSHDAVNPKMYASFLDRGYTVFAVVHGSQPKFTVTEVVQDIHRAVRFIRHNAANWGVNPDRLGISGASAGGHLSLTMGTQGGPGDPKAKDPIDRESSAVQAVACFFPPTDFLNYGTPGEDAVGVGILKDFKAAFGPRSESPEDRQKLGREISPIYFVTAQTVPTLIIHGDADKLVPVQQAQSFVDRATATGVDAKLIVKPDAAHGWVGMEKDMVAIVEWFDAHLPVASQ
ncbi:MAG TPA: alpha/beta hydrolase [Chthoniobacteraceae bacterium]|nr:alpha/beta hydrolase [Chthoniobacteraceae bacterium]